MEKPTGIPIIENINNDESDYLISEKRKKENNIIIYETSSNNLIRSLISFIFSAQLFCFLLFFCYFYDKAYFIQLHKNLFILITISLFIFMLLLYSHSISIYLIYI